MADLRPHLGIRRRLRESRHRAGCRAIARRAADDARRALVASGRTGTSVAIVLVEHFGDVVACEPVVRHLRARSPDARIVWVTGARYRPLVEAHPDLDGVVTADCLCVARSLERARVFDEVVDLHPDLRPCPEGGMPPRKPGGDPSVTVENYYEHGSLLASFCKSAGLPPLADAPRLHLPAGTRERVDRLGLPARFAVFHCCSNEESRDWRDDAWRELAQRTREELGVPVVEVGTVPVVGDAAAPGLCGKTTLPETAEVVRRASLFVGVDSGPAHLANAAGTAGVVLLGRYKSFVGHVPYSGRYAAGGADLVRARGPASRLTVDEVFAAVRRRLAEGAAAR